MGILKSDAHLIIKHIDNLKQESWLATSQEWWVDHLFHFNDISNAVEILKSSCLLSRVELERQSKLKTDIASPEVLAGTPAGWKGYVRLYFRPRTPMQYRNEGFRPINKRELGGAHCPVPIIFIFHSKPILTAIDTKYSDGNLAAGAQTSDTVDFFLSLPFEKIYHDANLWGLSDGAKRNIIFHRHAEVIVPKQLDLTNLKFIWCRSQAEFETLIDVLPHKTYTKWAKKIGVGNKALLFYAKWSFITKTDLDAATITFHFNPSQTPSPFHAKLEIMELKTKDVFSWEKDDFNAHDKESFSLTNLKHPESYLVKFWLDGQLAYQNHFIEEAAEVPF